METKPDIRLTSMEEERARLSREIHDGLGQHLQGMKYLVTALELRMEEQKNRELPEIERLGRHLDEALESVRLIARDLSPVEDMFGGLRGALESYARHLESLYGVEVSLSYEDAFLTPTVSLNLFWIVQEATANAVRHGCAHRIEIELTQKDRRSLVIHDDGIGFDVTAEASGLGLRHMRARAQAIDAKFDIGRHPDAGMMVFCRDWSL